MRTMIVVFAAAFSVGALASRASGDPRPGDDAAPCAGCTLALPEKQVDMPLVVVLGDAGETTSHAADRYRADALARGWAVLALPCPTEGGCVDGKWTKWGGTARYVTETVARIEREHLFDSGKVFLAGAGEGAAFVGMHAAEWRGAFAAVVLEGGGSVKKGVMLPVFVIGKKEKVSTGAVLDWLDAHARPVLVASLH